jgi:hypothetical protein
LGQPYFCFSKKKGSRLFTAASFLLPVSFSPPVLAVSVAVSPPVRQALPLVEAYALADALLPAESVAAKPAQSDWVRAVCLVAPQAAQVLGGCSAALPPGALGLPRDDSPQDAHSVAPPDDWVEPEPVERAQAYLLVQPEPADSAQEPDGHSRQADLPVLV